MQDFVHHSENGPPWGALAEPTAPRALSIKTMFELLRALHVASRVLRARWDRELRLNIHGMNVARASAIMELAKEGHTSQVGLARLSGLSQMTMTRLLDDLEEAGWVRREPTAGDRRSHEIHLTADGRKLLAAIYRNSRPFVRRCLPSFDEKRVRDLIAALGALS